MSGTICSPCSDSLCDVCDNNNCSTCKNGASIVQNKCQCNEPFYESDGECHQKCDACKSCVPEFACTCIDYAENDPSQVGVDSSKLCKCIEDTSMVDGVCVHKGDYLPSGSVTQAVFDSLYIHLTVVFSIDTQRVGVTSDSCSFLFKEETTKTLGKDPVCLWNNDKELYVTLGYAYSLRDGNPIYVDGQYVRKSDAKLNTNINVLTVNTSGGPHPTPVAKIRGLILIVLTAQQVDLC